MFHEHPSEGFIIESFTSVTRYYSLCLERVLSAEGREGKTFSPPGKPVAEEGRRWSADNVNHGEGSGDPRCMTGLLVGIILLLK